MPGQQYASALVVEVEGRPLPEDLEPLLHSGFVDDNLNLPDLVTLRFRDPDRVVVAKAGLHIGAMLRVSVRTAESAAPRPLVTAEITALELEHDGTGTYTVARGYDRSHRLFRGRTTQSYRQVTISDVVPQVARRAGIQVGQVDPTRVVHDHLSQTNCTDWAFLSRLAGDVGYELAVEEGRLSFRKPTEAKQAPAPGGEPATDALVLNLGTDLLRLRATVTSSEQVKQVQVRGWDVRHKQALVGTAAATTTSAVVSVTPSELAERFGGPVLVATGPPRTQQAEVDSAATALADQVAGSFAEIEAVCRGNPMLRAGTAVAIGNAGAPFDGQYTLTCARHELDVVRGYTTRISVTGRQERSLLGLTASGAGPAGRVAGVTSAVVTDARDPEERGRVRLRFPWLSDDYVSDWTRTVQVGAGASRGALVVPEVNDEVLVAFEQGDTRHPYVLGGVYNGVDGPLLPDEPIVGSSGSVDVRSFVSRTGHRLDYVESAAASAIRLTSGDGALQLELDQSATRLTVTSDGTVLVEGARGVKVDAGSGDLELVGKAIRLESQTDVSVKGSSGVTVDAGAGTASVTSSTSVSVTGAQVTVDGSARTEVKGGLACSISAAIVRIN